jgi:hypothetical protein
MERQMRTSRDSFDCPILEGLGMKLLKESKRLAAATTEGERTAAQRTLAEIKAEITRLTNGRDKG